MHRFGGVQDDFAMRLLTSCSNTGIRERLADSHVLALGMNTKEADARGLFDVHCDSGAVLTHISKVDNSSSEFPGRQECDEHPCTWLFRELANALQHFIVG